MELTRFRKSLTENIGNAVIALTVGGLLAYNIGHQVNASNRYTACETDSCRLHATKEKLSYSRDLAATSFTLAVYYAFRRRRE
jgi:hypothetical protein